MTPIGEDELVIVRHAPADHGGRLCGRTDVPAILPGAATLAPLRLALQHLPHVSSPALRCVQTAKSLFDDELEHDAHLWEQDFGIHDGLAFADLPDLGPLSTDELASVKTEGGESFIDMVNRVGPAIERYADKVRAEGSLVLVAHAGTARSGLALALGATAPALIFEIAPLSLTRLRCFEGGLSVIAVNQEVVA